MSKKDQYESILKVLLGKIKTWETFYEFIEGQMGAVRDGMHPVVILDTLFTMHAFFVAMRENPEESDVTVLVSKMVRILVYESHEKLGVDLEVVSRNTALQLALAHAEIAQAEMALRVGGEDAPKIVH